MIQNREFCRQGSVLPMERGMIKRDFIILIESPSAIRVEKMGGRRRRKRGREKLTLGVVLNLSHNIIVLSDVQLVARLAWWLDGDTDSFRVISLSPVSSQYFQPPLSLNINGIFVQVSFIVPPTHSNVTLHVHYGSVCHSIHCICLVCLHPVLVQLSVCVTMVRTCPSGVFVSSRADVL